MARDRLSPNHIGSTSINLDSALFDALTSAETEAVIYPNPRLSDLEQYGMDPSSLRAQGEDVPEDDEEALEFAIDAFREEDQYYEWKDTHMPMMMFIWPVDYVSNQMDLAQRIAEEDLAVVYVDGSDTSIRLSEDSRYDTLDMDLKGFMLTGGGMNLADHLAMAYILADYIPPIGLLESAYKNTHRDEWKEKFVAAMEQAASYYSQQSEYLMETVSRYREKEIASPSL